jgi:hypothetical protein
MTKLAILSTGMVGWLALWTGACETGESNGQVETGDAGSSDESKGDTVNANSVMPAASGSVYSFQFGDTLFAVDANQGGRIVTFARYQGTTS